jgi:hypothetical protein
MNNLSLNFFTSTKGHFGAKNIYKYTLNNLLSKSEILKKCFKIAHIKISPGDEEFAKEMEIILYKEFGFNRVGLKHGKWSHSDGSSHLNYLSDIKTLYSNNDLLNIQYGLHQEDDFILNVDDFDSYILDSLFVLGRYPNILTNRHIREGDDDILERTKAIAIGGWAKENNSSLFAQSCEFSFNPTFIRNKDMNYISNFTYKTYPRINGHCERAFGLVANYLNSDRNEFGFYDNRFTFINKKIWSHIGCPEKIKELDLK